METITLIFTVSTYAICGIALLLWIIAARKARIPVKKKLGRVRRVAAKGGTLDEFLEKHGKTLHITAFCIIAVLAVVVRLWQLGAVPWGLNQDEASIGYDSFAIGLTGYCRNGFRFPIYPIGFGNGHGPLYTYLSIPAMRLLGPSIFSVRITNALISCAAVFVSYFLILRLTGSRIAALLGFFFMATAPTLIITARWALDGSPPPALFIIALYFFVRSIDSQKTLSYALSAAFFAVICYAYGPVAVVVPVFLFFSCIYLLYHKKIKVTQLLISAAAFLVVIAPVAWFMALNVFDIAPDFSRGIFMTYQRFTGNRADTIFLDGFSPRNFITGLERMVFQPDDLVWNTVRGFGTTFLFTAPLIMMGILLLFFRVKIKKFSPLFFVAAYFIASFVMAGLLDQNINRISVVYPAVLLLIILAVYEIGKQIRYLAMVLILFVLVSFAGFAGTYFGESYRRDFGSAFFYSFGDAVELAMEKTDDTIFVTRRNTNMPGILTLFYSELPPQDYFNTVIYLNPYDEFRWEASFDRFVFGTPHFHDPNGVFVICNSEAHDFDPAVFSRREFMFYSVVYPRELTHE
ncbi:MAG: glycosyltransferase family 39 protein [Defluviitaleaceae bacterium]|nr:glycosyltransferase family 39 protein [Defluviitaleaceae bacterium]